MLSKIARSLALVAALAAPHPAIAEAPEMISYQGLLTLPGGHVVPDGSYTLTFRILEEPAPQAVEPVRFVQQLANLQITNGLYNVILSSQPGYDLGDAFDGPTRFMELTIDAAPPEAQLTTPLVLLPRQRIASVPYSLGIEPPRPGPRMWHQKATGLVTAAGDGGTQTHPIPGMSISFELVEAATVHAMAEGIQSVENAVPRRCSQYYHLELYSSPDVGPSAYQWLDARKVDSHDEQQAQASWLVQASMHLDPGEHTVWVTTASMTSSCFICGDPSGAVAAGSGCSINVQAFYD